jgi:hypothetical protein
LPHLFQRRICRWSRRYLDISGTDFVGQSASHARNGRAAPSLYQEFTAEQAIKGL